jgi:ketosteroid isomerase-like protein
MSQEDVQAFTRCAEAFRRRDIDAVLEELDAAVEWHDALPMLLGGERTVFRGHEGVRELQRELWDALDEIQAEFAEIRDLGDRIVATGRLRTRGRGSGIEMESPYGVVADYADRKATLVWTYLDSAEALEAAGLEK